MISDGLKEKLTILDISEPMVSVYPFISTTLSIIQSENSYGWIMNNFLQLCSNGKAVNFYDFNHKLCPFLKIQRIDKEIICSIYGDFSLGLAKMIQDGYYCYLLIDKHLIDAYCQPLHKIHDMFVYGVDIKNRIFLIGDYIAGRYTRTTCSFEEMNKAALKLNYSQEWKLGFKGVVEFIKYDDKEKQDFSLQRVKDSLCDYINSRPTCSWNVMEFRDKYNENEWFFGISIYKYIHSQIDKLQVDYVSNVDFHIIYEHKLHIERVLKYIKEYKGIQDNNIQLLWHQVVTLSNQARNVFLLEKKRINNKRIQRLHDIYYELEERERYVIPMIINFLCDL